MKTEEFVTKVLNKEIDIVSHTKEVLAKVKEWNSTHHHFTEISEELALSQAQAIADGKVSGRLAGVMISVKDCLCVTGVESRAGSAMLKGYIPLFTATCVQKVVEEGGIIIGKTSQDAFGFGSFSVNVGNGMQTPKNPHDINRCCGGSSGGSGGITALADFPHISIGESTGGSIECPASFNGVIGFCPTYGLVSRYGLIDYGNSLDKIGPMSKTIEDSALLLEIMAGHDPQDSTSVAIDKEIERFVGYCSQGISGLRIGVIETGEGVNEDVKKKVDSVVFDLAEKGATIVPINLPTVQDYALSAYYLLSMTEASTNLAKLCGMRYGAHEPLSGSFNEYFSGVRTEHFNTETKRRIMIGTFARMAGYRDAYYLKAAKVRNKIIKEYQEAFNKVDVIICPTMPFIAPKFTEIQSLTPVQHYAADSLTVGPNLAGIPHMSFPVGTVDGMPVGMLISANHYDEQTLFRIGGFLQHTLEGKK